MARSTYTNKKPCPAGRPSLSIVLADALELSAADRTVVAIFLRAAEGGLDIEPESVRSSDEASIRAMCRCS